MILLSIAAAVSAAAVSQLPSVVKSDIEYSREMCRSLGFFFQLKESFIESVDLNSDNKPDYIVDTRGFYCGKKAELLFNSKAGTPLYIYLSNKTDGWDKVFNAYIYEYQVKKDYGQMPYVDVWIRGEVGYQVVHQRYQWKTDKLEIIEQEIGSEVPQQLWKKFD